MLLLLDLDNTLVDRDLAFSEWVSGFVAELGGNSADREWLIAADVNGYASREKLAADIQKRFALGISIPDLVHRLLFDHVESIACYSGVEDSLVRQRAAGDRLVVVTAQQSQKMRFTGLTNLVDGIVISESAGAKKPAPEIFRQALEYRADTSAIWMVGDNADADIRGAHRLGLSTGWVSHEKSWVGADSPTIIQPTTVRVLEEIHLGR